MTNFAKNMEFMSRILLIISFVLFAMTVNAVEADPTVSISFDAKSSDEKTVTMQTTFEGSAPIEVTFHMELTDADDWTCDYEWRFCHEGGNLDEPYMIRYEEEPQVTFVQAGTDSIALYATFKKGDRVVSYRRDYWNTKNILTLKASESSLVMPNAFSPNNDGDNDYYAPKSYQSIIEFAATIYNRWGQKIYEWNDVSSKGWDGKFHGSDVKEGTYFVYVKARGADGRKFVIKKDVNLLRSYNEYESSSTSY